MLFGSQLAAINGLYPQQVEVRLLRLADNGG